MQPGRLNRYLTLKEYDGAAWQPVRSVYGAYKYAPRVIYSGTASGVPGAVFTLRPGTAERGMLIALADGDYLAASVDDTNPAYTAVQAAKVRPEGFVYERTVSALGKLNRPENRTERSAELQGVFGEKYVRHDYILPGGAVTVGIVLTVPKAVVLRPGDTVIRGEKRYAVLTAHTEDEALNDYEIERRDDA